MARKKKPWKYPASQKYHATHPWVKYVCWARRRCSDKTSKWFQFYGAKGITCTLTADQAKVLWERDKAHLLKRPSLDREKSHLGYTFENCRFIEFNVNSRLAWDESFRFLYNGDDSMERDCATDAQVGGEHFS